MWPFILLFVWNFPFVWGKGFNHVSWLKKSNTNNTFTSGPTNPNNNHQFFFLLNRKLNFLKKTPNSILVTLAFYHVTQPKQRLDYPIGEGWVKAFIKVITCWGKTPKWSSSFIFFWLQLQLQLPDEMYITDRNRYCNLPHFPAF